MCITTRRRGIGLALGHGVRISIGALRNTLGLLFGFGFGLILTSPTVSALSMIPGLSLLAPSHNSNVSGTITFVAAADAEGLVSLQFKIDGADYGSAITSGSCRATFDTRSTNDGPHTIQAVGTDEYGNTVFTSPATIFVNNVAPAISGVVVSNITSSSATVTWSTAAAADGRVDYGTSMSYGASAYDSNVGTSHSVTLSGLSGGTTYHFAAMSFGSNGILSTSGNFVFTTSGIAPTPTPNPTPVVPSPTPTPGGPTPTPTPTPIFPTPVPTPVPTPTPVPVPTPVPSPTPTATPTPGTRGRTAPSDSTYTGSATARTDGTPLDPLPPSEPVAGSAVTRGGATVTNTLAVNPSSGSGSLGRNNSTVGGSGMTAAMFLPGGSSTFRVTTYSAPAAMTQVPTTMAPQVQTPTSTPTQQRGATSTQPTQPKSAEPMFTPCAGPNPFLNDGGGKCVNGTWIKDDQPASNTASSTAAQTTGQETTSVTSAPVTSGTSSATSVSKELSKAVAGALASKSKSGCTTPDPFAARGGVGICVNGEWLALVQPKRGGK